ncbi:hypothetical protein QY049_20575 [Bradyrhizobium sp. WYCCWR 13022]|uniref:hypothetical protein n=1 Tax=unclassified Bradyrhizobium TaxID=2631580 RepID=UPI00263B9D86|nr:hypothetical protein [Bradyrhizobium sp. WYCCWR 13022]MDN4985560.1 hypothetical protein [Bradyrhizobium sp. WYCCWR 13022]
MKRSSAGEGEAESLGMADRNRPGEEIPSSIETAWSRELVKQIAKDVGDAVAFHIETMYPRAFAAAPSTFPLSVRNTVYNEIMAAVQVNDAGQIAARLEDRKRFRRKLRTGYRKMRASPVGTDVA